MTESHAVHHRSLDVDDFAMPQGREEAWRFSPLNALKPLLEDAPAAGRLHTESVLPDGAALHSLDAATARARAVVPADRIAALAVAHAEQPALLSISSSPAEPVFLTLTGSGPDLAWSHLGIEVAQGVEATVVVEHNGSAQVGEHLWLDVADGAHINLVLLQSWAADTVHAGQLGVRLGRDATARTYTVTLGGRVVRLLHTVDYAAPGSDVELLGLYFADAGQHLEHRLFVDHSQPHCRSKVEFKGAVRGAEAHAVWVGDVLIRAGAIGTDTYEINRNLVLSDGARADSVPNLEIETGEVAGAGHASTTGRFDDEQLFYLQSRGIPADEARRMVVRGFFADLIARIPVPELRERLNSAIDAELNEVAE